MIKPYQFNKNEDTGIAELLVYGDITSYEYFADDVSAFSLKSELAESACDVVVRINSYGGEVKEGLAIYNSLKEHAMNHKVTTICDGFACSAASIVFCAGSERIMPEASLLMIHNAWSYAEGDAEELRKQADNLEKVTQPSINVYTATSNLSEEEIKAMMDAETWITADEALEYGFATSVEKIEAKMSMSNEQYMIMSTVLKNKELQKEVESLKETKEPSEPTKDPWSSYFGI